MGVTFKQSLMVGQKPQGLSFQASLEDMWPKVPAKWPDGGGGGTERGQGAAPSLGFYKGTWLKR